MWQSQACSDCECCAADRRVAPIVVRITNGAFHFQPDEIAEHDVDHRTHARHRGAYRNSRKAGFRNRRIQHPLWSELVHQARQHFERMPRFSDIFAQNKNARVAPHLFR